MKIAVVTTSYPTDSDDGAGHFIRTEVDGLRAQGHEVTVIAPHDSRLFGWPGALARLKQRPWRILALPRFVQQARSELESAAPDQVIAHWLVPSGWPVACFSPAGTSPSLAEVVVHGSDARLLSRLPRPLSRRIVLGLCKRHFRFRFVSRHLAEELRAWCPEVVHWYVEPCAIEVGQVPDQGTARHLLNVSKDAFLAVCVGRIVPSKRIDAAITRAPAPPSARWAVIGDGPQLDALRAQFPAVTFTGRLSRTQTLLWMRAANVLVHASLKEGAPSVIREARALGTQVWASPAGDVPSWANTDPGIKLLPQLA